MADVAELVVRIVTEKKGDAGKELDATAGKVGKISGGIKKAAIPAAAALGLVGGMAIKAAQAAAEDAQGQALLAQSMKNAAGASKDQIAATEDWIAKQAAATGVADDQLRPALGALVRATGDVSKSQDAMSVALDVSAATGKDLQSVSEAMAKGYAGNTTALGKLVPGIDKATLASKDMNKIMADLSDKTGGSAAAAAETAAGKMDRMKLAIDETVEGAGGALLPIMEKLSAVLLTVATWAQKNSTVFVILASAIAGIAVAVLAVNAAMKIYQATMIVVKVVQNAVWLTNPIFLVIAAVALLVIGIVILWKKSETFRNIVIAVWNSVKMAAVATWTAIRVGWNAMVNVMSAVFRVFGTTARVIWSGIQTAINAVKTAVGSVSTAVSTLIGWIKKISVPGAIKTAFENMKTAADKAWGAVKTLVGWVEKIVVPDMAAPFTTAKTAIDKMSGAVESLIGWLKNIKVPKISIPKPGGKSAPAAPAIPAAMAAAPRVPGPLAAGMGGRAMSGAVVININGAIDPESTARQIRRILGASDIRHSRPGSSRGLRTV